MTNTDESKEKEVWENYKKQTEQGFNPYSPELYALVDLVGETETYISDLRKFIELHFMNPDSRQAARSVGQPDSASTYNTKGVLVRV